MFVSGEETCKLRKGQLVQGVVISVDKKRGAVGLKSSAGSVASTMVFTHIMFYLYHV